MSRNRAILHDIAVKGLDPTVAHTRVSKAGSLVNTASAKTETAVETKQEEQVVVQNALHEIEQLSSDVEVVEDYAQYDNNFKKKNKKNR